MEYLGFIICVLSLGLPNVSPLSLANPKDHMIGNEGDDVTFECSFTKEGFDVFKNPVAWYKMVDGEKMMMNNMGVMNTPFGETGRYAIDYKLRDDGIDFDMTITDLKVVDNGTYYCEMSGEGAPAAIQYTFIVPVPIEELDLFTNKSRTAKSKNGTTRTVYEFTALEPTFVSCQSIGGNPEPELKLMRGDQVITSEFQLKKTETREGPKGLEAVTRKLELTRTDFRANHDQSGQKLKCVAKAHRMEKSTVSGTIDVKYAPQFECQGSRYLKLPIQVNEYVIDCVIKGNPAVQPNDVFWTFTDVNTTRNLTVGQVHESFTANASNAGGDELKVTLTISGINDTHFNTYHIQASNEINIEHFEIYVGKATTTTSTTTTTTTQKPIKSEKEQISGTSGKSTGNGNQLVPFLPLMTSLSFVAMFAALR